MATKARKKYKQKPTVRLSDDNIEALKRLRDCLEIKHEKDMIELNIKDLSINDALTYVMIGFARRHTEIADELSIDSRMSKILNYSGCV